MTKTTVAGVQYLRNSTSSYTLPVFLVPALVHYPLINSASQVRSTSCLLPYCNIRAFSTTPCPQKRPVDREKNKSRGVSAIRRTGPRVPLPIAKYVLPRPVLDPPARKQFKTNPKHGLWGFFNADKTAMSSPEQELAHGRSWTYAELDYKSFEDLHNLYWVCVKEKNRIATAQRERHRVFAGYGDYEAQSRDQAVTGTMGRIRRVLTDRYHTWQEARAILSMTPLKDLPLSEDGEYEDDDRDQEGKEEVVGSQTTEPLDDKEREEEKQSASSVVATA